MKGCDEGRYAIITIRDDEFSAVYDRLEEHLSGPPVHGASERTYANLSVPTTTGKSCIVAMARSPEQGNDVSQQVASDVIRDLDPQLILVVGIAGTPFSKLLILPRNRQPVDTWRNRDEYGPG